MDTLLLHILLSWCVCRAVESFVKSHPEHVNVREQIACTPLHLAATEGEIEVAKALLNTVSVQLT